MNRCECVSKSDKTRLPTSHFRHLGSSRARAELSAHVDDFSANPAVSIQTRVVIERLGARLGRQLYMRCEKSPFALKGFVSAPMGSYLKQSTYPSCSRYSTSALFSQW